MVRADLVVELQGVELEPGRESPSRRAVVLQYLGLGVFALLGLQIATNLGVVVGLLPTKGLPLPLISLGGSNLLVSLIGIGTVLNMAEPHVA